MRYIILFYLPITFTILALLVGGIGYILSIFGLFDAISRYKEYKKLKTKSFKYKLLKVYSASACQRNMCIAIYGNKAKKYFNKLGYKWYNILPDLLLSNPIKFFSFNNLKQTYFK